MIHKKPPIGKTIAPAMIISVLCLAVVTPHRVIETAAAKTAAEERAERIEAALFTRAEFFGAQAIIPYPTVEARARLDEVRKLYPQDSEIELKLAELDESWATRSRRARRCGATSSLRRTTCRRLKGSPASTVDARGSPTRPPRGSG